MLIIPTKHDVLYTKAEKGVVKFLLEGNRVYRQLINQSMVC